MTSNLWYYCREAIVSSWYYCRGQEFWGAIVSWYTGINRDSEIESGKIQQFETDWRLFTLLMFWHKKYFFVWPAVITYVPSIVIVMGSPVYTGIFKTLFIIHHVLDNYNKITCKINTSIPTYSFGTLWVQGQIRLLWTIKKNSVTENGYMQLVSGKLFFCNVYCNRTCPRIKSASKGKRGINLI